MIKSSFILICLLHVSMAFSYQNKECPEYSPENYLKVGNLRVKKIIVETFYDKEKDMVMCEERDINILIHIDGRKLTQFDEEYSNIHSIEEINLPGYEEVYKVNYFAASGSAFDLIYFDKDQSKLQLVPGGRLGIFGDDVVELDTSKNPVEVVTVDWIPGQGCFEQKTVFKNSGFVKKPKQEVKCQK